MKTGLIAVGVGLVLTLAVGCWYFPQVLDGFWLLAGDLWGWVRG